MSGTQTHTKHTQKETNAGVKILIEKAQEQCIFKQIWNVNKTKLKN